MEVEVEFGSRESGQPRPRSLLEDYPRACGHGRWSSCSHSRLPGELFGPYGAVVTGIAACSTAVLLLGRDAIPRDMVLAGIAVTILALTGVTYARLIGVEQLGTEPLSDPSPSLSPAPTASMQPPAPAATTSAPP